MKDRTATGHNLRFSDRSQLCRALGVTPNRHADWRRAKLLGDAANPGALDAIELAILDRMFGVAGPRRAKRAWQAIRPGVRRWIPTSKRSAWVVIDMDLERDAFALSVRELASSVALESPVWVIPLAPVVRAARKAHREHARDRGGGSQGGR